MDIFIVKIDDDIDENILEQYQKKEFTNPQKRKQHCLAYYIADKILENVYNIQNREIKYENGKPLLESEQKNFSLSHSGMFIAAAFSDSNCGIDIEEIKPKNFKKITERMKFESCETLEDFYKDWTNYEAKYKLGKDTHSAKYFQNENYQICAVSENAEESYQIYIKNLTDFSK